MAKRTVGKPMFMADMLQYLKVKGHYFGADVAGDTDPVSDPPESMWNMNPSQMNEYSLTGEYRGFSLRFNIDPAGIPAGGYPVSENPNMQLAQLLSQGNYAGILGHNLGTLRDSQDNPISETYVSFYGDDDGVSPNQSCSQQSPEELVNYTVSGNAGRPEYDGFSLWKIGNISLDEPVRFARVQFNTLSQEDDYGDRILFNADTVRIGALTYGRWFEPEHAFDIKATIDHSYDGVKLQNTIGGSTLSNISYLGQPNWGNLPAWTLEKQLGHDYNIGANRARRSWKVGLSYLTDDNLFDKAGNENKFFTWTDQVEGEDGEPEYVFDSSLSSFFKLTLMGKLPFIFCPDSSADDLEFALCRITNKPSFKQVANNLFSTSLVITETY